MTPEGRLDATYRRLRALFASNTALFSSKMAGRTRAALGCFGLAFVLLFLAQATARSGGLFNTPLNLVSFESEQQIVLSNAAGVELHLLTLGAVAQRLLIPDRAGKLADVLLGFDDVQPYKDGTSPYFGAVIGRVANRIALGRFSIGGRAYNSSINDPPNSLHGGTWGWSRRTWALLDRQSHDDGSSSVTLGCSSADGEEGYPGAVNATVTYTLSPAATVTIEFAATSSAETPINMAQHAYFNLDGVEQPSTVLQHIAQINSSYITPVDPTKIPTGAFQPIAGTAWDFSKPTAIGDRIQQVPGPPNGYDHNYVLFGRDGDAAFAQTVDCQALASPAVAATVRSAASGRKLEVLTTAPGLQFYTGNYLDGSVKGKGGVAYPQYGAFCLETQMFPNTVNQPKFPQCNLRPGDTYRAVDIWRFSVK